MAKTCYGRAIDAYLAEGRYDDAIGTCQKLLRIAPGVVRTHYTLALLLVGQERLAEARAALRDYVDAVLRTGTQSFALPRLRLLAEVTRHPEIHTTIEALLVEIGAATEEQQTRDAAGRHGESEVSTGQLELWKRLISDTLREAWVLPCPEPRR